MYNAIFRGVFAAAMLIHTTSLDAQTLNGAARWADSARREIDAATIAGDAQRLSQARVLLDRALIAFPDDALLLHYQGYALYREVTLLSSSTSAAVLSAKTDTSRMLLERSASKKPMAETAALLTAVYGRQIAVDHSLGPMLGMLIEEVSRQARSLGPDNPRVFLIAGEGAMFTPPEWGGGVALADSLLSRAAELFSTDAPAAPAPAWGRAEAYAWLGQARQKLGRRSEALAAYNKALEAEPSYTWVSRVLIPGVAQKQE